jgi:cytochrome c-type biogenesis protein CcmH
MPGGWRFAVILVVVGVLVVLAVGRQAFSTAAPPATPQTRAYAIGERLACPICEGLSVADSPSALAQQMRAEITEQIAAGQSDAQIQQYFIARYGPAILLTPPKQGFTLLVWWVPVLFLVAGAAGVGLAALRWSRHPSGDDQLPELSADEEQRYAARLAAQLPGSPSGFVEEGPDASSGGFGGPHSAFGISPPRVGESQGQAIGDPSRTMTGDGVPTKEPSSQARSAPPRLGERSGEGASSQPSGARARP